MTNPSHEDALAAINDLEHLKFGGTATPQAHAAAMTRIKDFLEAASRKLPTRKAYAAQRKRNKAKRKKVHA